LLRVDRDDFRALIATSPALREKLSRHYQDINQANIAKRSRLFRLLSESEGTGGQERRSFKAGETIFAKGVRSDALHYILWGEAELVTEGAPSVKLGPGQCFGESAVVEDMPLDSTIRATSDLTTLAITGAHLRQRQDKSSDTRDFLASMNLTSRLPAGAKGIQYLSFLGGEEILERQYQTEGGRKLHSSFALGSKVFRLSDLTETEDRGGVHAFDWSDPLLGKERHVTLDAQGYIADIRSSGDWPQLPNLIENALTTKPLAAEDFVGFERTGALQTAHLVKHAASDNTVCYCMGVDQDTVSAAVARGCATLDDLRRETGCGSVCGGCIPRLREWFGGQGMMPAVARRLDRVPDIASFQFYPREGSYPAPLAGQHLVVDGLIADRWISRRYSITSVAAAGEHVEITVKREPMGVFSGWLFDGPTEAKVFRLSEPTGEKTWDTTAPGTVCIVGGIGVTPAISILRTAIASGNKTPLHIDYSFTDRNKAAFVDEIQRAANEHSWITCRIRDTEREGRMTTASVAAIARHSPGAVYHLCGPAAFMTYVEEGLKSAGVPASAIKSELFVHSGLPTGEGANAPFWGARRLAYAAAALVLLALFPFLTWSSSDQHLGIGPATMGHESLACADCHETAPGSTRQQLQANVRYLLGQRAQPADFVHRPVTTATCETCHSMQAAVHAPFMFLEPRYQPVRETLGPHECVNCHVEHDATRVSLGDTLFCKSCHETVVMKNDPLDVAHAELAKTGQWNTCMGCHDYHGNHKFESQTRMADRFPNGKVEDYFKTGSSPYGERKTLATTPKRTTP
jgi:ferredoxin-NADP reductase/CRP-like cAMP-binding protein